MIDNIHNLRKKLYFDYVTFIVIIVLALVIGINTKLLYFSNETLLKEKISYFSIKDFITIVVKNLLVSVVACGFSWNFSKILFYCMWLLNGIVFGLMLSCFDFPVNVFLFPIACLEITSLFISRKVFLFGEFNGRYLLLTFIILVIAGCYESFGFIKLFELWRDSMMLG
jgi:hypothetical protein